MLLTTQYLEEADELADQIVVVDHGRVIADGTPQSLKDASKGAHLEVMLSAPHADAVRTLAPLVAGEVTVSDDGRKLSAGVESSTGLATVVVRALDAAGVLVDNIEVRQPSLDDVFFSLTGEHVEEVVIGDDEAASGGAGDWCWSRETVGERAGRSERLMSTTTLTPTTSVGVSSPRSNRLLGPLADIWAMTRRNLVHISREPMQLSDVTIQPVSVHVPVRLHLRRGDHPPGRRQLQGLPVGRHPGPEPGDLDDGDGGGDGHGPPRRHDRPLPGAAHVAAGGADRAIGGGLHDLVPVRPDRGADRSRDRVAGRCQLLGDPQRAS